MAIIILVDTLIDGTGREPLHKAALVIDNGRITRLGSRHGLSPTREDKVIEAEHATALPGLIDSHCHLFYYSGPPKSVQRDPEDLLTFVTDAVATGQLWLSQGVTTVRDVAAEGNLSLGLRDAIEHGKIKGPRVFASGRALAMTGGVRLGIENIAIQVDSPDEARRAAREQLRAGVDLIKLFASAGIGGGEGRFIGESGWPQMTVEEMAAAVFEAHKAGRTAAAHAISAESIKNAVNAGVDTVEHCNYVDEEGIDLMKKRDVVMVPTLAVGETLAESGARMGYEAHIQERSKTAVQKSKLAVGMARAAGIRIAAGTDPVTRDTMMRECDCLHRAGLTPMEVIVAATRTGAELLRMQEHLGTLEQGKIADVLIVEGNPLDDLWALERVQYVLKAGQVVRSSNV